MCGTIHYENPLNVVGTVPVWQDQVLLCRRNIEPRYGLWTLPAGFMELGETLRDGALRETIEEAGAQVEMQGLFTLLNVVRVGQCIFLPRAAARHALRPGPETIEARLFREDDPLGADRLPHREGNPEALVRRPPPGSIRLHTVDIG